MIFISFFPSLPHTQLLQMLEYFQILKKMPILGEDKQNLKPKKSNSLKIIVPTKVALGCLHPQYFLQTKQELWSVNFFQALRKKYKHIFWIMVWRGNWRRTGDDLNWKLKRVDPVGWLKRKKWICGCERESASKQVVEGLAWRLKERSTGGVSKELVVWRVE